MIGRLHAHKPTVPSNLSGTTETSMTRTETYYEATAPDTPPRAALEGEVRADICIVGGGFTGVGAALELAARGFDVRLLEAKRIGAGASGRNGGQINYGFSADAVSLAARLGIEPARALWAMAEEAVSLIDRRVAEHGIDCDLRRGFIYAAARASHMEPLRREREVLAESFGYSHLELLDPAATAAATGSGIYHGGLRDPRSGHLHPLKYLLGLAAAAETRGAVLHEHSPAISVDGENGVVRTARGAVRASHVLVAANAYLDGLLPPLGSRAMPVGTWVVATRPLTGEERAGLLPGGECVCDTHVALDYYRFTPDARLLFGGGVSYRGRDGAEDGARLLGRRIARVYPALAGIDIDHAWGGRVSITRNRLPDIGRIGRRLYYAHGFSGQGVALTGMAGQGIAEAIAGDAARFDVFASVQHGRFPGGAALRQPLLALFRLWYRLRDRL